MKVGILTFHRAHNYGAVLQCYALQEVLKGMGHEVEVIDYRQPFIERYYSNKFPFFNFMKRIFQIEIKKAIFILKKYIIDSKKSECFRDFRDGYLNLSSTEDISLLLDGYDCIVIGSDQVWSLQSYGHKFDSIFFGDFLLPKSCKLFGYAISGTCDYVVSLSLNDVRKIVNNYTKISFRESKMAELTGCICDKKFPIVLDPTLLTTELTWTPLIDKKWEKRKYIILYLIDKPEAPFENSIYDKALQFAQSKGYEVVDLLSSAYKVSDFVSAIKFAKAVFTTSFHATVFSVIFNIPIYAFNLHNGREVRYVELLQNIGAGNRIFEITDNISNVSDIDYNEISKNLNHYKRDSIDFINRICE